MASKLCPKCGTLITTSSIPNFCYYGCGSLENVPIFPEFKTFQERCELIQKAKEKNSLETFPSDGKSPDILQMKLF